MPRDPQGAGTRTETLGERYERLAEEFYAERMRLWRAFLRTRHPIPPHAGEETTG